MEQEGIIRVELEDVVDHPGPPGLDHVDHPVLLVQREAELDGVAETKFGRMLKKIFQTFNCFFECPDSEQYRMTVQGSARTGSKKRTRQR